MQRRSFFGVVFGGFLARWFPRKQTITYAEMHRAYEAAAVVGEPVTVIYPPGQYVHHFMEGGFYKPGDLLEITGPDAPDARRLRKLGVIQ